MAARKSTRLYEQARRRYRPKSIKVLFVAEAPPANLQRFFYFEKVREHDWLFLALVRWLYDDARALDTVDLRERKRDFLRRFTADGYYLVDANEVPMPKGASPAAKRRLLTASLDTLTSRLRKLRSKTTRIVLLSSSVYRACCVPLRAAGINVANTEGIDFPSTGHQRDFARKLGQLLDENLRRTIQALEKSVRFWAPGKANQKVRERYVVQHFLHGLGIPFADSELLQPDCDPPDVRFGDASFEVKEVQDRGRTRHTEYKRQLERARQAERHGDLIDHFSPEDMPIAKVCARLMEETAKLAAEKYPFKVRSMLDLLFYVNFGMEKAWGIEDGPRLDLQPMRSEGWRSVSFLHGTSTCCVLVAHDGAPAYLRTYEGQLMHGAVDEEEQG